MTDHPPTPSCLRSFWMPPRLQFSEQHQLRWREEIFDKSGQGSFLINVIVTFERLGKTRLLCLFTITLDTVTLFIVRSARSNHSSIMEVRKLYIFCKTTGWKGIKICTIRCRRIIEILHRHIQLGIFTLMCWQLLNFINSIDFCTQMSFLKGFTDIL